MFVQRESINGSSKKREKKTFTGAKAEEKIRKKELFEVD
jgi:hypothetical protein